MTKIIDYSGQCLAHTMIGVTLSTSFLRVWGFFIYFIDFLANQLSFAWGWYIIRCTGQSAIGSVLIRAELSNQGNFLQHWLSSLQRLFIFSDFLIPCLESDFIFPTLIHEEISALYVVSTTFFSLCRLNPNLEDTWNCWSDSALGIAFKILFSCG